MKIIELVNGQIIEEYEILKEIKSMIMDNYINNKEFLNDDSSLYIKYKDGSSYYICGTQEDGIFKKTGIKTVIENNPETYGVYGKYKLTKVDNSESDNICTWLINN
ncbi:MAG: hypothetical protein LIR50_12780 [Bacillota bacterium]|nr:hypothetical protein [Bacillota bacterium]